MKRIVQRIALLALTAALSVLLSVPSVATGYDDVAESDWFAPAVTYVAEHDLFRGVDAGVFAPYNTMSRSMFYTVLSRLAGAQVDDSVPTNLTDVPAGRWYTGAVIWSLSSGIAKCHGETSFGADEPITRAEICLALVRYDAYSGRDLLTGDLLISFSDLVGLDQETRDAIDACQVAGIVQGRGEGLFCPQNSATRAEVAQIFRNFCLYLEQSPADAPQQEPDVTPEEPPEAPPVDPEPWQTAAGWTGQLSVDFPLSAAGTVSAEQVTKLNERILTENQPKTIAEYGATLDGNARHLTNYGAGGLYDCYHVTTILDNRKTLLPAGVALSGDQEYYGYSLQTQGVTCQDSWHSQALDTGKDPWQCTWWAWGRAAQYLDLAYGLDLADCCGGRTNLGNGKDYYRMLAPYFLSDQTPAANTIVSWTCGSYGHVAYVEAVDAGGIWVSMADSGHTWRGVTYIARTDSETNPYPLGWYTTERFNGFNHLDFTADGSPITEALS